MCINVDNSPLQAAFVKNEGDQKVFQGRTLQIQFQVNKPIDSAKVSILSKEYDAFPEDKKSPVYECFVPIKCEEMPNEYPFTVEIKDKVGNVLNLDNKFQVIAFPFQCQTLQVSQEKMEEERKLGEDSDEFKKVIKKLSKESPKKKLWKGAFITPIEITSVTTPFGIIRTTPDKGQYRHKALDVINLPRCIVWAPQNGIVVLKDRYVHSGNTVVIDHGQGVLTLLFHLDSYAHINVGDKIKKGDPVGRMGKTGYAKGYHLHWEMRIGNTAIDPMQWVKGNF
jgi:murein DD-endopeptidase MepM/ murein hydrolase activator NlpD